MAGISASSGDDDMITGINVTPLVDVMLVLLIIFMLTANMIAQQAIEVDLPEASTGEGVEPTTVALTLTEGGELFLNGQAIDPDQLQPYLTDVAEADPKTQAIIAADRAVAHGAVIGVIDRVRAAGITKFALNIDPTPSQVTVQ